MLELSIRGLLSHAPNQLSVSKMLVALDVHDRTYTVQDGDTLSQIVLRLNMWLQMGLTSQDLVRINKLETPDVQNGQVLKLCY